MSSSTKQDNVKGMNNDRKPSRDFSMSSFTRLNKMEVNKRKPREIFYCRLFQNRKDVKGMNKWGQEVY